MIGLDKSWRVDVYSVGLCMASACAPKDMPLEEVLHAVDASNPTGLDHGWKKSSSTKFRTGQTNPCVCEKDANRVHYLLEC